MTLTRGPHGGSGGRRWPPGCSWRGRVLACWNFWLFLGHERGVLRSRARLRNQPCPRFHWQVGGGSGGRPRRLRTRSRPVACFWLCVCRKLGILCSIIIPAPSERREAGRTLRRTRAANGIKKILRKTKVPFAHPVSGDQVKHCLLHTGSPCHRSPAQEGAAAQQPAHRPLPTESLQAGHSGHAFLNLFSNNLINTPNNTKQKKGKLKKNVHIYQSLPVCKILLMMLSVVPHIYIAVLEHGKPESVRGVCPRSRHGGAALAQQQGAAPPARRHIEALLNAFN